MTTLFYRQGKILNWSDRGFLGHKLRFLLLILEKDSIFESLIALARGNQEVKDEIKAALNQDQVIDIAASRGYQFDSLTILRRWSKHTDFSKDTWMGWFSD